MATLPWGERVSDGVQIQDRSQVTPLAVTSGAGAQTAALPEGLYAVWADVEIYIKVGTTASDVTVATGYVIRAGASPDTVELRGDAQKIGGIATSTSGTLRMHRIG